MRMEVLKNTRFRLAGSVAVLALATLMAGCSADTARFDDGFYTGAVPRQPVPRGDVGQRQAYPGGLDRVETGSVAPYGSNPGAGVQAETPGYGSSQAYPSGGGGSVRTANVERTMLPPPSAAAPAPSYEPAMAPQPEPVQAAAPAAAPMGKGWHKSNNQVTLGNGETIDTLSTRYGVPAKAILSTNGLSRSSDAVPGQQISIPTYSYGGPVRTANAGEERTLGAPPAPLRAPTAGRPAPAAASSASIVVESGDSLMGISRRTGVSVTDLKAANNLTSGDIKIGQKLRLPGGAAQPQRVAAVEPKRVAPAAPAKAAEPEVRPAAQPKPYSAPQAVEKPAAPAKVTAEKPAPAAAAPVKVQAPSTTVSAEEQKEVATAAPSATGIDQFRWPVQGRVLSRYGEKSGTRRNDGLDISVPRGTPVKAAENGVVIYAGDGLKEFGNTVLIKHDNGLVTVYGHADTLKVKRGATVRRGEEIATAGVSGDTDTPMLHFEVRKNSAPVDPAKFLQ
ncbi:peptidoglycan DD-metalloendopeptidase family protein [Aureimonas sp. SA4125]|uniref:peptidoglycan DD-metalloendopeptidase family protein n=1 Tax=Aureimonas sp. SA4125 TaxID=2826993 RepID=UPI001CC5A78C|nr:peptidoglycan DD-metalloendopeptidase family protein [Aureimonas sp. SA4125]